MRVVAMAVGCICFVSPAAAQVPTVLGGVDVYRSTRVTAEWLESTHDTLLLQLVDALGSGRYEAVGPRIAELGQSLDAPGDIVYRDLGLTTSFEADTNRVWIMLDVVERADSATRLGGLRSAPRGAVEAAHEAVAEWQAYEQRAIALVQAREVSPVVAACPVHHCLLGFEHPELARYRALFDTYAGTITAHLTRAVREDSAATVRASALFVLAHARDAQLVASTAAEALDDPASAVRNNALRVLAQLTGAIPGGVVSDVELPVERVLHALDDPSSTVRNKAALIVVSLAARPEYRDAVLGHGEALLRLLRLRQVNNHEPAHVALQALSGHDFGARDYDAWERWLAAAQRTPPPGVEGAIVAAWRSSGMPPVDYVVSRFAAADWVFLGEYHRIRDDVRLIADLIPALHSRTDVRHLAAEFLCRDRTPDANELISAPTFERSVAVEFLRSQDPHWPYEEYVELLRAAWESNRVHAAQRGTFRFVGLHPCIEWETINYGADPEAAARERRKQEEYDAIMAAELEKHLLVPGHAALIYTGVAHSTAKFTEYRYGTDRPLPRMGNMVYREPWDGRMFFIALHAPFWDAGTGADIYPFDGVLDRAMLSYRAPVGFDVSGAPFDRLGHARRSERSITFYEFRQLYDGYIMHATPLTETVGVTCITDWIVTDEQFRHFWRSMPNMEAAERFSAMPLGEFRRDFCAPSADHGLLFRNRFRRLPSLRD